MKAELAAVKESPILFSTPMVRAIDQDMKGQTRRVITPQPNLGPQVPSSFDVGDRGGFTDDGGRWVRCPRPGDRFWVQETFRAWQPAGHEYPDERDTFDGPLNPEGETTEHWLHPRDAGLELQYRALEPDPMRKRQEGDPKWRSARFMPRWCSRTLLEVRGVRVERVQAISEEDAVAEGSCIRHDFSSDPNDHVTTPYLNALTDRRDARTCFAAAWDDLNGSRGFGWAAKPWCRVYDFKKVPR